MAGTPRLNDARVPQVPAVLRPLGSPTVHWGAAGSPVEALYYITVKNRSSGMADCDAKTTAPKQLYFSYIHPLMLSHVAF